MYLFLAEVVVLIHFLFILYALFGGLFAFKWKKAVWIHLCAMAWGFYIEITGSVCPLTPLEVWLRVEGGGKPYEGGFISQYIIPLIYPENYDLNFQVMAIIILFSVNAIIYGLVYRRVFKHRRVE